MVQTLFDVMLPRGAHGRCRNPLAGRSPRRHTASTAAHHEQIRDDLKAGRIGLAQNRLPANAVIEDVTRRRRRPTSQRRNGTASAARRRHGSIETWRGRRGHPRRRRRQSAGPRAPASSRRSIRSAGSAAATAPFVETHLAKSRRISRLAGTPLPHIFTTSYLSHDPTRAISGARQQLRLRGAAAPVSGEVHRPAHWCPPTRDLRFAWEEMPQQTPR